MLPLLILAPSAAGRFTRTLLVDAIRFGGENGDEVLAWGDALGGPGLMTVGTSVLGGVAVAAVGVAAPGGMRVAGPGDWIVRGPAGDLAPIGPDAFAAAYAPAPPATGVIQIRPA